VDGHAEDSVDRQGHRETAGVARGVGTRDRVEVLEQQAAMDAAREQLFVVAEASARPLEPATLACALPRSARWRIPWPPC